MDTYNQLEFYPIAEQDVQSQWNSQSEQSESLSNKLNDIGGEEYTSHHDVTVTSSMTASVPMTSYDHPNDGQHDSAVGMEAYNTASMDHEGYSEDIR